MDYKKWNQIFYELVYAISAEKDLKILVRKAIRAFLKKLDCAQASILHYKNRFFLEPLDAIPRVLLKDAEYYQLIYELEKAIPATQKKYILMEKDLYYYGFPLKDFGLLLLGRARPLSETVLKELDLLVDILARNCSMIFEITKKQKSIETALQEERQLLRVIIDTMPDLIFFKDMDGIYQMVNQATLDFLSLPNEEIIGKNVWDIHLLGEANKCWETDFLVAKTRTIERYETKLTDSQEITHPFEVLKAPVINENEELLGTVSVCRDIKIRKHYEQELVYIGTHDQLTGLYNRRFLEREMKFLDTEEHLPISIIMGDLNGLKLINDIFGHQMGDKLIIKAARTIKKSCRSRDFIIRWGGDEFVIFLPNTTAKAAQEISARISKNCSSQKCAYTQLNIALGLATKERQSKNIWQVFKEANERMFKTKLAEGEAYKKDLLLSVKLALAQKNIETEIRIERIKRITKRIGQAMALPASELSRLELLAEFHNIGLIIVRKNILLKPGPLTEIEWEEIVKHPETGYRFAQALPELSNIAEEILAHHEYWDGRGYPRGLKAGKIPLLARILAVADAFDSMTKNSLYRPILSTEKACSVLQENAGKQFDPKVVDIFNQLIIDNQIKEP